MPASDPFPSTAGGLQAPALHVEAVTPHDTNELAHIGRGLYITGAGDVKFVTAGGETVTLTVPANFLLPVRVKQVFSTNTTATGIFNLW